MKAIVDIDKFKAVAHQKKSEYDLDLHVVNKETGDEIRSFSLQWNEREGLHVFYGGVGDAGYSVTLFAVLDVDGYLVNVRDMFFLGIDIPVDQPLKSVTGIYTWDGSKPAIYVTEVVDEATRQSIQSDGGPCGRPRYGRSANAACGRQVPLRPPEHFRQQAEQRLWLQYCKCRRLYKHLHVCRHSGHC